MAIVWILLWILAFITILKDPKTESTRWLSLMLFITGLGSFCVVLDENVMTLLIEQYNVSKEIISSIHNIVGVISSFVHAIDPYCILIYGLSYSDVISKNKRKIIYTILLIPPILSMIFLPIKDNNLKTLGELMLYFKLLSVWAVPYILGSSLLMIYSYFKEKSYIMRKYRLLTLLIIVPCFIYMALSNLLLRSFGLENNWRYFNILIPFEFLGFLYFAKEYGVLGVRLKFERYKFAFEKVLDFVSDSVVALDEKLNIIEINKVFYQNFMTEDTKYKNFLDMIDCSNISGYKGSLIKILNESRYNDEFIEILVSTDVKDTYFQVQTNSIIIKNEFFGTVLVFKDITLYKNNLELIKQNQLQLIEKERLLSLSQLIGGVAHNLKTPLMSSAGGIQIIKRDTKKIYEYIENNCSDLTDITKLIDEVNDWQQRIIEYLVYMSNVITVVKGQVTEYSETTESYFSIKEIAEKITFLMAYEIKKSKCVFVNELNIDYIQRIKGDVNSLMQVLNNLITNAIEASKQGNVITLGSYIAEEKIIFYIRNFGQKIPEQIQSKIFNKMVTTKGNNGTGLGLYISKSIIKVRFNGEISFETNEKQTTFFIKIPLIGE
ncbi:MAG TPA: ATP-binding protein [Clostridium sp.]|uniref:ATP-binding protein n=1 Tax=Clostridium sp. TaxID=1506 RepID=UPI002F950435